MEMFKCKSKTFAILLNITPDHLDRYDNNFDKYIESKFRIIQNQTSGDALIYCFDDPVITQKLKHLEVKAQESYPCSQNRMDIKQGTKCIINDEIIILV